MVICYFHKAANGHLFVDFIKTFCREAQISRKALGPLFDITEEEGHDNRIVGIFFIFFYKTL